MRRLKNEDQAAWEAWRSNRTDMNLQKLLQQMNPIIQNEVNRWAGAVARPVLETEAKNLAVEAFQTFNPDMGAALATHLTNRLKKLSRMAYSYQSISRMPEYQMLKYQTFNNTKSVLADNLGREPTVDELADELGWSRSALTRFQTSLRKEFLESGTPPPIFDKNEEDDGMVAFVYHDLPPLQQKIFEFSTGWGGAPQLDSKAIMKKLKLSQGQLSYQKRLLVDRFGSQLKGK